MASSGRVVSGSVVAPPPSPGSASAETSNILVSPIPNFHTYIQTEYFIFEVGTVLTVCLIQIGACLAKKCVSYRLKAHSCSRRLDK